MAYLQRAPITPGQRNTPYQGGGGGPGLGYAAPPYLQPGQWDPAKLRATQYGQVPQLPPPSPTSPQDLYSFLSTMRGQSLGDQVKQINQYGGALRQALFSISPELKKVADYYNERLENPIPEATLRNLQANYRNAAAAQGWYGDVGGPGLAAAEAEYLTSLQEQMRAQAVQQASGFGQQLLQTMGLNQVPDYSAAGAQMYLQSNQLAQQQYQYQQEYLLKQQEFEMQLKAARDQTDWARREYDETKKLTADWMKQNGYMAGRTGANYAPGGTGSYASRLANLNPGYPLGKGPNSDLFPNWNLMNQAPQGLGPNMMAPGWPYVQRSPGYYTWR